MLINLRPLIREDRDRLFHWRKQKQVAAYMYTDHQIGADEHARWFVEALESADRSYWIVEVDGCPVGLANLAGVDPARRRCEWAFYLAEARVRGRGVGAAVEFLMIDHVFGALGLHKLWCEVLLVNEAVWKLHQSFGFVREALYRDHVSKGGRFHHVVGLGLLAPEWAGVRAECAARLAQKGHVRENLSLSFDTLR